MTLSSTLSLQASTASNAFTPSTARSEPAGSWKLDAGRAVTLHSAETGVLRIAQGRVWATLDGPHAGPANDQGDFILQAGERLTLLPGQRVVLESWDACANEAAYFSWDPKTVSTLQAVAPASRWQVDVLLPLHDLGHALAQAAQALGRLVWGLAGFGEFVVAGRGRVMPRLESNQP